MKKYLQITLLILFIFLCTGCVKYEENMKIKNNKSLQISLVTATDDDNLKKEMFKEQEISNLKKFYNVTKYNDNKYDGYKLTWSTSNIDNVSSSSSDIIYDLSSIRESVPTKIFRVRKGIFKNTYYANFIFDATSFELENNNDSNNDLVFSVELDKKSIDNNADTLKNDGKKLIWNLKEDGITEISFSFSLYNSVYICVLIFSLIVIFSLSVYSYRKILEKRV